MLTEERAKAASRFACRRTPHLTIGFNRNLYFQRASKPPYCTNLNSEIIEMLLTITTTHRPATDLGYLLRKNPARVQSFEQSFGVAHVFYPEATADRCTAALILEIDPVGLVRNRRGAAGEGRLLEHYVNDRPHVAASFLSVGIADVF